MGDSASRASPSAVSAVPVMVRSEGSYEPVLEIENLNKSFVRNESRLQVLADVTMRMLPGGSASIIGPSGCGKSTLLRIVGGLERYDSGRVSVLGSPVDAPRNDVGFMFQGLALIPWRTVRQNVRLPGELLGMDKDEIGRRLPRCIELVGLTGFENYHLREISGGMRQRVALARMLMADAKLLLLDEPFSSLDELTRETIDLLFLDVCARSNTSFLMVTHSIFEAVLMSDRVFVMSSAPARILDVVEVPLAHPRTKEVMNEPDFMERAAEVRRALEAR